MLYLDLNNLNFVVLLDEVHLLSLIVKKDIITICR